MGVNHLWTILEPVKKQQKLSELSGSMFAVDLSMWIMESKTAHNLACAVQKPYLRNLFFRISALYNLGVNLVFVVDGKPPEIKSAVIKERLVRNKGGMQKNSKCAGPIKRSRFQAMVNECIQMLESLGVPYVRGEGEAEAMCAFLNRQGIVDGCITDDGDAFLYGATRVCRNFTIAVKDPHVDSYCMQEIEQKLKLNRRKLIGLAVLLGCDYFPKGVPGVGPVNAVSFMQKLSARDVDVLDLFGNWDNRRAEKLPNVSKPTHCSYCQHPGSKREHNQFGCSWCGLQKACSANDESMDCPCDWHASDNDRLEVIIRSKAVKTEGFPAKAAVDEFLFSRNKLPKIDFSWKRPCISDFVRIAVNKMNWTSDYSAEKIIPFATRWQMLHAERSSLLLKPYRIIKTRVKRGIPSLQVEWFKPDILSVPGDYVVTIEPTNLFCQAFENLYVDFQTENVVKKKKSKSQKKTESDDGDHVKSLTDITNTEVCVHKASKDFKSRKPKCTKSESRSDGDKPSKNGEDELLPSTKVNETSNAGELMTNKISDFVIDEKRHVFFPETEITCAINPTFNMPNKVLSRHQTSFRSTEDSCDSEAVILPLAMRFKTLQPPKPVTVTVDSDDGDESCSNSQTLPVTFVKHEDLGIQVSNREIILPDLINECHKMQRSTNVCLHHGDVKNYEESTLQPTLQLTISFQEKCAQETCFVIEDLDTTPMVSLQVRSNGTFPREDSVIIIESDDEELVCQPLHVVPELNTSQNMGPSLVCVEEQNTSCVNFLNDGFMEQFSSLSLSHTTSIPYRPTHHMTRSRPSTPVANESVDTSRDLFGTPW